MNGQSIAASLLGNSPAIREVRQQIAKLAPATVSVLIEGPTGAGKELVARALHTESRRRGRFVAVNLSALNDGLFEASVFGHEKGAFTGAEKRLPGYLPEAHNGTVFFDELSELPKRHQVKLLRALESKRIRRIGSELDIPVDFRIVSATNVPLEFLISAGSFRHDLAQRIAGIKIIVPPLAERREDIRLLAEHFARNIPDARFGTVVLEDDAVALLEQYEWPGNVRELRNVIESAVALAEHSEIHADDVRYLLEKRAALARAVLAADGNRGSTDSADVVEPVQVENAIALPLSRESEKAELLSLLDRYGDVRVVAVALNRTRSTIYRRMQALGIEPPARRTPQKRRFIQGGDLEA